MPGPRLQFPAVMLSHATRYLTVLGKQNVGMTGQLGNQPPTHWKQKPAAVSRIDDEGGPDTIRPASGLWRVEMPRPDLDPPKLPASSFVRRPSRSPPARECTCHSPPPDSNATEAWRQALTFSAAQLVVTRRSSPRSRDKNRRMPEPKPNSKSILSL